MEQELKSEDLIIRYIFGDLPDKEKREFEELYFEDDTAFEELLVIENEFIDRYVLGLFSNEERERFQKKFLTSDSRRARVENARMLFKRHPLQQQHEGDPSDQSPRSWLQSLFAFLRVQSGPLKLSAGVALVLLAVGASSLLIKDMFRSSPPSTQQELSFDLVSNAVRGDSELKVLEIPGTASRVELGLYFESGAQEAFTATLQKASGEMIWREESLQSQITPSGKKVIVVLPAEILQSGTYFITVASRDHSRVVGEYQFRVVKK